MQRHVALKRQNISNGGEYLFDEGNMIRYVVSLVVILHSSDTWADPSFIFIPFDGRFTSGEKLLM